MRQKQLILKWRHPEIGNEAWEEGNRSQEVNEEGGMKMVELTY